jgi:hypothetical protein
LNKEARRSVVLELANVFHPDVDGYGITERHNVRASPTSWDKANKFVNYPGRRGAERNDGLDHYLRDPARDHLCFLRLVPGGVANEGVKVALLCGTNHRLMRRKPLIILIIHRLKIKDA